MSAWRSGAGENVLVRPGPRRHLHTLRRVAVQSELAGLVAGLRGLEGSADDRPAPSAGQVERAHQDPEGQGERHRRLSSARSEMAARVKSLIGSPHNRCLCVSPPEGPVNP